MRLMILMGMAAISVGACVKKEEPRAEVSSSSVLARTATPPAPEATSGERRRLEVRVTSCVPVGYGADCSCEVDSKHATDRGHARLQSCVGSGDRIGLSHRLATAPLVGSSGPPLSLWVDVEPAPDSERYCGILLMDSGERLRIIGFER